MIRYILLFLVIGGLLLCGCSENTKSRQLINLNQNWKFSKHKIFADAYKTKNLKIDSVGWEMVDIPHTPKIEPLVVNNQWQGLMWYKKEFSVKIDDTQKAFLRFEGVMHEANFWLNGKYIFRHIGGYLPASIDISSVVKSKKNILEVKIKNTDNPIIPPGKPLKKLDFNYYGGIYRDVELIITNKIYITDPIIANKVAGGGLLVHFSDISEKMAHCTAKIQLSNDKDTSEQVFVGVALTDKKGHSTTKKSKSVLLPANSQVDLTVEMDIKNPLLWSTETPNLYDLSASLYNNNEKVDEVMQKVGIRKIEIREEGFFLNNKKKYIRGTNRHQEYPYIGYALPRNAHYRDAVKIKQAGFDMVRLSHYPQDNAFLDACDELGIMVMNAIPGWQFYQDGKFVENSYQNIRDMVRRDRNHPSVVFWENSLNESSMTEEYIIKANDILKKELPFDDTYSAGWIDHPSYDLYIPARQHAKLPDYWTKYNNGNRKIFISEYGDWEYYAQNGGFNQPGFKNLIKEERTSRQLREYGEKRLLQQALNFQEAANSNRKGKNTIGHANWLMFDYNRGYSDDLESSGISDIFRIPKFSYYFYQSQRPPTEVIVFKGITIGGPMVKIATYWDGQSALPIKVYSNCDEVALYINGSLLGRKRPTKNRYSTEIKFPPFEFTASKFISGILVANGYINGKEVCSDMVTTPKQAKGLRVSVDKSSIDISNSEMDVLIAHAYVIDNNGSVVSSDNNSLVKFEIDTVSKMHIEIIGDNPVETRSGIASVILRIKHPKKSFKLRAYTVNMEVGEVLIK